MTRSEIVHFGSNYLTEQSYDEFGRLHRDQGPALITSCIHPRRTIVETFFYHGIKRRELIYDHGLFDVSKLPTFGVLTEELVYDNFGNLIFSIKFEDKVVIWQTRSGRYEAERLT